MRKFRKMLSTIQKDPLKIALAKNWEKYILEYINVEGQVIDKETGFTTSEGQSYALLRALWSNDEKTFARIWNYTKNKLQVRSEDKLFAWRIGKDYSSDQYSIIDEMNATDADLDIAFALITASRQKMWESRSKAAYLAAGVEVIKDIFKHRVVKTGNELTILPFNSQKWRELEILNTSYFCPAYYKAFSVVDKENDWDKLRNDTYILLNKIQFSNGLFPDWYKYDYQTGEFSSTYGIQYNPGLPNFGFDAFRTLFRVALDYHWYKNPNALAVLQKAKAFYEAEFKIKGEIKAVYDKDGNQIEDYETVSTNAAAYVVLKETRSELFKTFFDKKYVSKIEPNGLFDSDANYYALNWGWFTLAYETRNLKNFPNS